MSKSYIYHLKQPCINRGATLRADGRGHVYINGLRFDTIAECENYLESLQRIDYL